MQKFGGAVFLDFEIKMTQNRGTVPEIPIPEYLSEPRFGRSGYVKKRN